MEYLLGGGGGGGLNYFRTHIHRRLNTRPPRDQRRLAGIGLNWCVNVLGVWCLNVVYEWVGCLVFECGGCLVCECGV